MITFSFHLKSMYSGFSTQIKQKQFKKRDRLRSYHPAKIQKFEFFHCAQQKNSKFRNFCWMIKTQPISFLKLFLFLLLLFFWKTLKPCDACVKITRPIQKKGKNKTRLTSAHLVFCFVFLMRQFQLHNFSLSKITLPFLLISLSYEILICSFMKKKSFDKVPM